MLRLFWSTCVTGGKLLPPPCALTAGSEEAERVLQTPSGLQTPKSGVVQALVSSWEWRVPGWGWCLIPTELRFVTCDLLGRFLVVTFFVPCEARGARCAKAFWERDVWGCSGWLVGFSIKKRIFHGEMEFEVCGAILQKEPSSHFHGDWMTLLWAFLYSCF